MIRVLWKMPKAGTWMGGMNYFVNLGLALASLPEQTVEPVIVGGETSLPGPLGQLPSIPDYQVPGAWHARGLRNRLELRLLGRGRDYDRYLRRHGIDLLSHLATPARPTAVPFLAWIPDFQHRHLPRFFSPDEIEKRNRIQTRWAQTAQGILLSSEDARTAFNRFHPGHEAKTHVLRFVAIPPAEADLPRAADVLERHGIREPYFHVPNQIWAHKNHGVVLEALVQLRQQGKHPLVISTGQTDDYRDPEHFKQLLQRVAAAGLGERFRFLGMIDYAEVCVLMRNAMALVNPSLFEGWSTTVEEAKSLGKRLLLSDLPVHREQAPGLGIFFDPHRADELAEGMAAVLGGYDPARDRQAMQAAQAALPGRIQVFGREYEQIVRRMAG